MTARDSNIANFFETTLSASMGASDLTATVATTTGGPSSPCYVIIEPESASQREIIYMDGTFTSTTFVTSSTANRYLDGSAAGSGLTHPSGSVVWVAVVAQHIEDLHDRIDAAYTPGGTDVAVADGGTGASTAAAARTNLDVYSKAEAATAAQGALADSALQSSDIGTSVQAHDANNVSGDGTVLDVIKVTQAAYDALTPTATTLYVIVG